MSEQVWQLYGTLGCHLCEQAEQLLQQFSDTRPIRVQQIDIAELPEAESAPLATQIPVLQTAQQRLLWPFSLADLMRVYSE